MLLLLIRLRRFRRHWAFAGYRWLRRQSRDYGFLMTKHHTFLMSLRGSYTTNANFFLQDQMALEDDDLIDDRDYDCISLLSDRRNSVDTLANRCPTDVDTFTREELVDLLLSLMSHTSNPDPAGLYHSLQDGEFFDR